MTELSFFDIIRYSLEPNTVIPNCVVNIDWNGLYRFAEEQAILGVVFGGIQRLGEQGVKPPFKVLMKWIATAEQIKGRNIVVNKAVHALIEKQNKDGVRGCVLKGQGNNLMYPDVYARNPGDIDVWLRMAEGRCRNEDFREIIRYVRQRNHQARAVYHHIDYGIFEGVEVEVHYRPSFMFNPIHNRRLQKWFCVNADEQFQHVVELPDGVGSIAVPTTEFNVIFQLSHIYNHLLHEGIGLRQIIDYYYVLKSNDNCTGDTSLLKDLGLEKIAGAVMWVLKETLGLEDRYLIAPIDERRGTILLEEILRGGNFGHYDKDNIIANDRIKKNLQRVKRDLRMMRYFPSECLWEPVFRVWHFFWRIAHR